MYAMSYIKFKFNLSVVYEPRLTAFQKLPLQTHSLASPSTLSPSSYWILRLFHLLKNHPTCVLGLYNMWFLNLTPF